MFLWLDSAPEKLSPLALIFCQDQANELYLSLASVWEIQIKHQLGKLELDVSLAEMVRVQQTDNELKILSIGLPHIYRKPYLFIITTRLIGYSLLRPFMKKWI